MLGANDITVMTAVVLPHQESRIVSAFDDRSDGVVVVRRCVDVADVLAVGASGLARALLVSADLPGLDRLAIDQLRAYGIGVVVVIDPAAPASLQDWVLDLGLTEAISADAEPAAIAATLRSVMLTVPTGGAGQGSDASSAHRFPAPPPLARQAPVTDETARHGRVIAVWGPTGAPGRSTIALNLAAEISALAIPSLLIDADVYGGAIAPMLGLLDEAPGMAAACRITASGPIDPSTLARTALAIGPQLRVLTGISRVDRWPELRPTSIGPILSAARGLVPMTIVDCGFSIEQDEELSYDTVAPRRNGATIEILKAADEIMVISGADPIAVARAIRALAQLRELIGPVAPRLVVNKVRGAVLHTEPASEITGTFGRFAGINPRDFIPYDDRALDAATRAGRTLADAQPSSAAREAIRALAEDLTGATRPRRRRRLARSR